MDIFGKNSVRYFFLFFLFLPPAGYFADAAGEVAGAAEEYAKTKCDRGEVEMRCRDARVIFQSMLFKSLGGSSEAEWVIKFFNQSVADNADSPASEITIRF